jgi:hypothetical protein
MLSPKPALNNSKLTILGFIFHSLQKKEAANVLAQKNMKSGVKVSYVTQNHGFEPGKRCCYITVLKFGLLQTHVKKNGIGRI